MNTNQNLKEQLRTKQKSKEQQKLTQENTCQNCGTKNVAGARFCAECGEELGASFCPNCKAKTYPNADICEECGAFLLDGRCRFCYCVVDDADNFCPECGNPKNGINCPSCGTLNDFDFCKKCNTPLTENAELTVKKLKQNVKYKEMESLAKELQLLQKEFNGEDTEAEDIVPTPEQSLIEQLREKQRLQRQQNIIQYKTNEAVKQKTETQPLPQVDKPRVRLSEDDLLNKLRKTEQKKKELQDKIKGLLEQIAEETAEEFENPQQARCFYNASKPPLTMMWECNYANAIHDKPDDCAQPNMGGVWFFP